MGQVLLTLAMATADNTGSASTVTGQAGPAPGPAAANNDGDTPMPQDSAPGPRRGAPGLSIWPSNDTVFTFLKGVLGRLRDAPQSSPGNATSTEAINAFERHVKTLQPGNAFHANAITNIIIANVGKDADGNLTALPTEAAGALAATDEASQAGFKPERMARGSCTRIQLTIRTAVYLVYALFQRLSASPLAVCIAPTDAALRFLHAPRHLRELAFGRCLITLFTKIMTSTSIPADTAVHDKLIKFNYTLATDSEYQLEVVHTRLVLKGALNHADGLSADLLFHLAVRPGADLAFLKEKVQQAASVAFNGTGTKGVWLGTYRTQQGAEAYQALCADQCPNESFDEARNETRQCR